MQKESRPGQMTHIRCTADPTTHAYLMFYTRADRNQFVETLRRGQHLGGGMFIERSPIFIDRETKPLTVRRDKVATTEDGILKFSGWMDEVKKTNTGEVEQVRFARARLQAV